MDRVTFNTLLEEAELTKDEFAKIVELKYTSVNNWGSSQNVPHWVESWMKLYIENDKCKKTQTGY
jgi:DNA-binding XRE family transcriptional regulator